MPTDMEVPPIQPAHEMSDRAGTTSIAANVSESERAEAELNEARERFEGAFRAAPIGMAVTAPDGWLLSVNRSLCDLLERSEADLLGSDIREVFHPNDAGGVLAEQDRLISGDIDSYEAERRLLLPEGGVAWGRVSTYLVRDGDRPRYFVLQIKDITEQKEAKAELRRYTAQLDELARRDALTGLHSERELHDSLERALRDARAARRPLGVALLELEGLSRVNDQGGRADGDRMLRAVGEAVGAACREGELAARVGGNRLALLVPGAGEEEAEARAGQIAAVAEEAGEGAVRVGSGSYPAAGDTKELLLLRADMALHAAGGSEDSGSAGGGALSSRAAAWVDRILALARQQLGMDLAFLGEFDGEDQVFRVVDGDAASFGLDGGRLPLSETYCKRMVEGRIRNAVPDTSQEPEVCDLAVTKEGGIGAYLGVPLVMPDGRLYGALCGISHSVRPELSDHEVELMRFLAELLSGVLQQERHDARKQRAQAELSGVHALVAALEARDHYTGEHSRTVVCLATEVARRLGLSEDEVQEVEQVAILHDVGKVGIPDSILQKRGPLNDDEWELMRHHPVVGERVVASTETLAHLAPAVRGEHERWDGGGYPDGLRGEEIPLASRITLACDAYHAMTSDRPYRAALPEEQARRELLSCAGTQFDPRVVDALAAVLSGEEPCALARTAGGNGAAPGPRPTAGRSRLAPVWHPKTAPGSGHALGAVRCVCRGCGAHVDAVASRASLSGTCANCGGYDLDLAG